MYRKISFLILFVFILGSSVSGQDSIVTKQKDLFDIFWPKKQTLQNETYEKGKWYPSFLPVLGYAPAYGFVAGVGASLSTLYGDQSNTSVSTYLANVNVTSKEQVLINLRSYIYTNDNKWIFQGDFRVLIFTQPTYGLGIYSVPATEKKANYILLNDKGENPEGQPMLFNYIRFYENGFRRISNHLYLGGGALLEWHTSIKDTKLNLEEPDIHYTDHYRYSTQKGFNPKEYFTNGLNLSAIFDTRDNAANAYKGNFMQLGIRQNLKLFGSEASSTQINYEYRKYFSLNQKMKGQVLAFWVLGQFLVDGKIPYLALPSIGWDTYNRSGRGFVQGRFRAENLLYGETEYRHPVTRNGLIGLVGFFNATTMASEFAGQKFLDATAFGYGAGLRVKMTKLTRTNIGMDIANGSYRNFAIYFNLQETF